MAALQALVFVDAHKTPGNSMRPHHVSDVTVAVEADTVRFLAHDGPEITLTRDDVASIAKMAGAPSGFPDEPQPQQAELEALRAELAEAMGECIEFTLSYGLGDEERYRCRYRELTGHGYHEEVQP